MIEPQLCCPCTERTEIVVSETKCACRGENCPYGQGTDGFRLAGGTWVLIAFDRVDTICEPRRYDATARVATYVERRAGTITSTLSSLIHGTSATTKANCARFCQLIKGKTARPTVLVIGSGSQGSGTDHLWGDESISRVGIDIYPSRSVNYIADAHYLPFADESFDGVWIQAVLEHVLDPQRVVAEIYRVLRPGGHVYAETPFMQQIHEGPYDFMRFTVQGHRYQFRRFALIAMGPNKGPAIALGWAIRYFLWALLKNRNLAAGLALPFQIICRLVDPIFSRKAAWDGASGVFFLGAKTSEFVLNAREVVTLYEGLQR